MRHRTVLLLAGLLAAWMLTAMPRLLAADRPGEFMDMEDQAALMHIVGGLDDLAHGRFSDKSILDIGAEE